MKWSDGVEFTSADFMYEYEHVMQNAELYPVPPDFLSVNGQLAVVTAPDAYTVVVTFAASNSLFLNTMCTTTTAQDWKWWFGMYQPAHHAKNYHPDYIGMDEAVRRASADGFASWVEWYWVKTGCFFSMQELPFTETAPTLAPYVCVDRTPEQLVFERNAYYFKVDSEGNQLPYIDRVIVHFAESQDVVDGKIISGEVDAAWLMTSLTSMPIYKDNEALGGYEARLWDTPALGCIELNLTHPDPVIRAIFGDVRFRKALSLGLNRDELNEATALGLSTPTSAMVPRESPYYVEGGDTSYIEYDPATAMDLLDEMGLDKKDADGFRLRPDGTRLRLTLEVAEVTAGLELIREYWRDLGLDIEVKAQTQDLITDRTSANLIDMTPAGVEFNIEPSFSTLPQFYVPLTYTWPGLWANQWALYHATDGAQGLEPPAEMQAVLDAYEELKASPTVEGRIEPAKRILESMRDNVWIIATLRAPAVVIVKNDLMNVPETGVMTWDLSRMYPYYPMTWYFLARPAILEPWPGRFD